MKSEDQYDSFCMESKCLNQKNSFFHFDPDCLHVSEDHEIKGVSQPTFIRFIKFEQGRHSDLQSIFSLIHSAVDEAVKEIANILRANLFSKYIKYAETLAKLSENVDLNSFTKGMSEGNYSFLSSFIEFERSNKEVQQERTGQAKKRLQSILTSLLRRKIQLVSYILNFSQNYTANIERIVEQDLKEMEMMKEETSKKQMNQICQVNKNEDQNIELSQKKDNPQPQSYEKVTIDKINIIQSQTNTKNVKVEEEISHSNTMQKNEREKEESARQALQIDKNDDDESEQIWQFHKSRVIKSKLIKKDDKQKKHLKKLLVQQNIVEILPNQIGVYEMKNDKSTINKIHTLCPEVTAIHFFDKSLKNAMTIRALLNNFSTLQEISFNDMLPIRVLSELPVYQMMEKLKKIYLDGNTLKFHEAHFIKLYSTGYKHVEQKTELWEEKFSYVFSKFTKNQHLWLHKILGNKDTYIKSRINTEITSLECSIDWIQNQEILNFTSLTQLCVNTEGINNSLPIDIFSNFPVLFQNNTSLQKVFLYHLIQYIDNSREESNIHFNWEKESSHSIQYEYVDNRIEMKNQIFSELSKLKNLKVLFISENSSQQPRQIFLPSFTNLTHLYLDGVCFSQDQPDNFLSRLTCLKFLSLFNCSDVQTKHIKHLPESCFKTIKFLNIGYTKVTQDCLDIICHFENLTHFFLKDVPIKGAALIKMSQKYEQNFQKPHPLQMLNLQKKSKNLVVTFRQIISEYKEDFNEQNPIIETELSLACKQILDKHERMCMTFQHQQQLTVQDKVWNQTLNRHLAQLLLYFQGNYLPRITSKSLFNLQKKSEEWFQEKMRLNLLTCQDIPQIATSFPNLNYLNVRGHLNIVTVNWKNYESIKTIERDETLKSFDYPETEQILKDIFSKIANQPEEEKSFVQISDGMME